MKNIVPYQEFKTINEMIYVIEKWFYEKKSYTNTQKQAFEKRFVENLMRMQKNKKFQREYALYEEASAQGKIIIPPKNPHQAKLNALLKEMVAIDAACRPFALDNKEIWRKQADTRLKYEKRLRNNTRDIKLLKAKER